jgi:hypothetical protein
MDELKLVVAARKMSTINFFGDQQVLGDHGREVGVIVQPIVEIALEWICVSFGIVQQHLHVEDPITVFLDFDRGPLLWFSMFSMAMGEQEV